jgi:hypothetical protein
MPYAGPSVRSRDGRWPHGRRLFHRGSASLLRLPSLPGSTVRVPMAPSADRAKPPGGPNRSIGYDGFRCIGTSKIVAIRL